MGKTCVHKMSCGCEFWEGLDYKGEVYPEMQYCQKHAPWAYSRPTPAQADGANTCPHGVSPSNLCPVCDAAIASPRSLP